MPKKSYHATVQQDAFLLKFGVAKRLKFSRAVKGIVAANFYTDGNLFIERFDNLDQTEGMNDRRYRAKAIVDLAMSLECSMKSLIVCLSPDGETPADSYKKARKLSHHLNKLYGEVSNRAKRRFKLSPYDQSVFDDLDKLGVGSRYSQDLWTLRYTYPASGIFRLDSLISKTIDDEDWIKAVRTEAARQNNSAAKCYDKYLRPHSAMNGGVLNLREKEIQKFLQEVK